MILSPNFAFSGESSICSDLAENKRKIEKRVHDEDFCSGRSFKEYLELFGPTHLENGLKMMNPDQVWVDMGCGEDASALREFGQDSRFSGNGFGITVKPLSCKAERAIKKSKGRIRSLFGQFIEELPVESIPIARVITDLYGPFSYSAHPDQVLQRYFIPFINEIENASLGGPKLDFESWFKEIKGVHVNLNFNERTAKITKSSERTHVPELELIRIFDFPPPIRFFKITPPSP